MSSSKEEFIKQFSNLVEDYLGMGIKKLKYAEDDSGIEYLYAIYDNNEQKRINISADSNFAIVKDFTKRIDSEDWLDPGEKLLPKSATLTTYSIPMLAADTWNSDKSIDLHFDITSLMQNDKSVSASRYIHFAQLYIQNDEIKIMIRTTKELEPNQLRLLNGVIDSAVRNLWLSSNHYWKRYLEEVLTPDDQERYFKLLGSRDWQA